MRGEYLSRLPPCEAGQFPAGRYVVDFACLEANLVIELDGGQHLERHAYDTNRDRYIELQGFRVLRFWDNQVFEETAAVLEVILNALSSHRPHPDFPPPAGEEM